MPYIVIAAIDSLDPNPERLEFDTFHEAQDWIAEEIAHRVDFDIQHSPYLVSEEDRENMEQAEAALIRLEEV